MRAFSLVELSIVLVILGLLTGGILTGQSLIRAAELRAVTTEFQRYQSAVNTFRDKYFALPGDMRNATDFWTAVDGNDGLDTDCIYASGTGTATCNGDGNGAVDWTNGEMHRFWQHLANAGLIEGSFAGAPTCNPMGGGFRCAEFDINAPRSKLANGGWVALYVSPQDGTSWGWPGNYGDNFTFSFGGQESPADIVENGVLLPEEAWNIDTKLDDGKPAFGSIKTARTTATCNSTTVAANASSATYLLTSTAAGCFLWMSF